MSAFADVFPIIVGDKPPFPMRDRMRASGAAILPRRPYSAQKLLKALAAEAPYSPPGLWEVLGVEALPQAFFEQLETGDALVRHCLNDRRAERILERVRRIGPDIVVLCDTSMGLLAPMMRSLNGVRIVCGPHNFDSGLYDSMALTAPTDSMRRWYQAASKAFAAAERLMAGCLDQLWVCSEADLGRFAALVPPSRIRILPNVMDVDLPTPVPKTRNLVFIGQGAYYPNEDASLRLIRISQELDRRGIEHRLQIVGRSVQAVRNAASKAKSVEILGEVPSTIPYLDQAALVPIALTMGGGTRLKILEAMAAGRPVLSTPIGIEGIDAVDGVSAVIEPDLDRFPDRIIELLAEPEKAQAIADAGWALAQQGYSHERLTQLMAGALRDLGVPTNASESVFALNFGAVATDHAITFNPSSRLVVWSFLIRNAAPPEAITAEFSAAGAEMANAFVRIGERPGGLIAIDGSAVVPVGLELSAVSIRVFAWNRLILEEKTPRKVTEETGGLMILEKSGDAVRAVSWSDAGSLTVSSRGGGMPIRACTIRPGPFGVGEGLLEKADGSSVICETDSGQVFQPFYNPAVWLAHDRPANARLRQMENRHAGETAWLIGNGPSVRVEDLDALSGQLSFCFNRFHLAYDRTRFRPTYTVTGDRQMIEDFGQQIVDEAGGTVFVVHDEPPDVVGDYIWVRMTPVFPPLFSRSAENIVTPGGSSLYMAMQIAYVMGIRQFYLYGTDFKFVFEKVKRGADQFRTARGDTNHFISNYRNGQPWCPPSLRDIGAAFNIARRVMESEGGFIRNATHGGLMEMFERIPFAEAAALTSAGRVSFEEVA